MLKVIVYGTLFMLLINACSTSSISINLSSPAVIDLPKHINNVVVVNSSLKLKDNKERDSFDKDIMYDNLKLDIDGSKYCVEGLEKIISSSNRFYLKNMGGINLGFASAKDTTNNTLEWNEVKSIAGSYNSDALIVLEEFNTKFSLELGNPIKSNKDKKNFNNTQLNYPVILIVFLESVWRIYDVKNEIFFDRNTFTDTIKFYGWGKSYEEAKEQLISNRLAINKTGFYAGEQFGKRIIPLNREIKRAYYTGPSDKMKLARYYLKNGDWDSAINIWEDLYDNSDSIILRKSAFNLGLAYEIKKEYATAIKWVSIAHDLGDKKAFHYLQILKKINSNYYEL